MHLRLGDRTFDLATRALVMGILNRTPDSFYDKGATFSLDALLARAEQLVTEGADILDVGGVKAGPGPEVTEAEELDRVVPAIEALHARLDVPLSVDTWRASVARAGVRGRGGRGQRHQRVRRPRLPSRRRRSRGGGGGDPHPDRPPDPRPRAPLRRRGGVGAGFSRRARHQARSAGVGADQIVLDAGLDLGKTAPQSLELLRASACSPVSATRLLLSASNKPFLGVTLDLDIDHRQDASLAAAALGVSLGCRIVRAHDVVGTRRVCDALAAVLEAA